MNGQSASRKDTNRDKISGIPGGVYLCQVNEHVSCGACCGLYNQPDFSFDGLAHQLRQRTEDFAGIPREISEILRFGENISPTGQYDLPYPEFHHCPYVGFIDPDFSRIGCLLHPLAQGNNGVDLRGLSYYGGMACRTYFCPTHRLVPERFKTIVRAVFDNWYEYGLVVTEHLLINACFHEIESRRGRQLDLKTVCPENSAAIYRFLTLKLNWPFRSHHWPVANYFFEDQQYVPPPMDYAKLNTGASVYHTIFKALGSHFSSREELWQAESIIKTHLEQILRTAS